MEEYWIWLSSVEGIGAKRFYQLLSLYEDARSVWDAMGGPLTPPDIREALGPATLEKLRAARDERYFYRLFDKLERCGMLAVTRLSDAYPPALTGIYDPPPTLYVRGDCPLDGERMFAVVGSRQCTRDGQRAAREFAQGLAESGVTVVSGMARGIDSWAHRGALEGHGQTVAVLGCGADVVYPPENDRLLSEILDSGGAIVSELLPGTPPIPGNFPARNRIISGLCQGTLIVEGAKASGAMITVNFAPQRGAEPNDSGRRDPGAVALGHTGTLPLGPAARRRDRPARAQAGAGTGGGGDRRATAQRAPLLRGADPNHRPFRS